MRKGRRIPGFTRIKENEFKAGILAAMKTEPDLCARLRHAITKTAARRGVPQELRDQYLGWIGEVEAALGAMAEADRVKSQPLVTEP